MITTKTPLVIIGGGDSFESEADYLRDFSGWKVRFQDYSTGWKETLYRELADQFEVLIPAMPRKDYAHYEEWKSMFEQFALNLGENTIFVGHSLGWIFLAKYLAENTLKCGSLHLISAPFEKVWKFELPQDISKILDNTKSIHLWHSEDDKVVDIEEVTKYASVLPGAKVHLFWDRGHFNGERFDELADVIKKEV